MGIDLTTAARPYAKAAFEYAVSNNILTKWANSLQVLAQISINKSVVPLLTDPRFSLEERKQLFCELAGKWIDDKLSNFISLLAQNRRLAALPEIYFLYEEFRRNHEKIVEVEITSFLPLSQTQQKRLTEMLVQRLKSKVTLNYHIDKNLLGGLIVQAGDLVIDGSILGQIHKMRHYLVA